MTYSRSYSHVNNSAQLSATLDQAARLEPATSGGCNGVVRGLNGDVVKRPGGAVTRHVGSLGAPELIAEERPVGRLGVRAFTDFAANYGLSG